MSRNPIPFWKKAPFFRLLLPLCAGILLQWYLPASWFMLAVTGLLLLPVTITWIFLPLRWRYRARYMPAFLAGGLLFATGMMLVRKNDLRNDPLWIGQHPGYAAIVLRIVSGPEAGTASLKCRAELESATDSNGITLSRKAGVWLYLAKDSLFAQLKPGSRLLLRKPLAPVSSSGNPYAFDYKRYSLFQGVSHQLYLRPGEAVKLAPARVSFINRSLPAMQQSVLEIIRRYVTGEKEAGLAEALLIGYKPDLDPDLITSYTNTGLAHVIAISGMHLALVYWVLHLLFRPLAKRKQLRWLAPLLTIAGLWIFTLLAGAQPSVLRAAVMFSCIVAGKTVSRNSSIYNSLSASAFLLLCYNPFWLWDLGFILSYSAVVSLLVFMNPIYRCAWFSNRFVNMAWQSVATSTAAQVLTLPVSIYSFHQFPNYFVLSNLVAVPVSTAVLFAEILLCAVSFIPPVAAIIGHLVFLTLKTLNGIIDHLAALPFATWDGLQVSVFQVILLYILTWCLYRWFREKKPAVFTFSLFVLLLFVVSRSISFYGSRTQEYLAVYNVPKKQVLTRVQGRNCVHLGDSTTRKENSFHLAPVHTHDRLSCTNANREVLPVLSGTTRVTGRIGNRRFVFLRSLDAGTAANNYRSPEDRSVGTADPGKTGIAGNSPLRPDTNLLHPDTSPLGPDTNLLRPDTIPVVDILITGRSATPSVPGLCRLFRVKTLVLDSSVPSWLAEKTALAASAVAGPGLEIIMVSVTGAFRFSARP